MAIWFLLAAISAPNRSATPCIRSPDLVQIERRACRYFWRCADSRTGLVSDRADNRTGRGSSTASIAATGYALGSLPIAVNRRWVSRALAFRRARNTLVFILRGLPAVHGWYFHFVNKHTGRRQWSCEVSSMDTALLVCGALACGRYFGGEVRRDADDIYARVDWRWMRTNGGARPDKYTLSHGWTPEHGFLADEWSEFSEGTLLCLLGLGAPIHPLPQRCWLAWSRKRFHYAGLTTLSGGSLFMHLLLFGFLDMRGLRDRLGYDYGVDASRAIRVDRRFCSVRARDRRTYADGGWGITACDGPRGYQAYGIPDPEDGTVAPYAALASIVFRPRAVVASVEAMLARYKANIWGRYGFADAYNLDARWYDPDVVGIDLGMSLLAVENCRSGLVWRLMSVLPSMRRAFRAAGLHRTSERGPRPLRVTRTGVRRVRVSVRLAAAPI